MDIPTNITRSTLTVLVPGMIAIAPWLLALVQHTDATLGFKDYPTLAHAALFSSVIVAGVLCEGLGTWLESFWDKSRESEFEVSEHWYAYLSRSFESEPVGYRYLSRLATAMYFELSMFFAAPSFIIGAGVLSYLRFPELIWLEIGATFILAGGAMVFFSRQAHDTHKVICTTRREIMRRVGPP